MEKARNIMSREKKAGHEAIYMLCEIGVQVDISLNKSWGKTEHLTQG